MPEITSTAGLNENQRGSAERLGIFELVAALRGEGCTASLTDCKYRTDDKGLTEKIDVYVKWVIEGTVGEFPFVFWIMNNECIQRTHNVDLELRYRGTKIEKEYVPSENIVGMFKKMEIAATHSALYQQLIDVQFAEWPESVMESLSGSSQKAGSVVNPNKYFHTWRGLVEYVTYTFEIESRYFVLAIQPFVHMLGCSVDANLNEKPFLEFQVQRFESGDKGLCSHTHKFDTKDGTTRYDTVRSVSDLVQLVDSIAALRNDGWTISLRSRLLSIDKRIAAVLNMECSPNPIGFRGDSSRPELTPW